LETLLHRLVRDLLKWIIREQTAKFAVNETRESSVANQAVRAKSDPILRRTPEG
jgi:hypothetical protein